MIFRLILLIISVSLYFMADNTIDYALIHFSTAIYSVNAVTLVWKNIKNKDFINFNILFSSSFFFCSYAYSLFVIDTPFWDLGTWSTHMVNFNYVTRGVTLSTVSYCVYCLGYTIFKKKMRQQEEMEIFQISFKKLFLISSIALSVNVLYSILSANTINITSFPFISVFFRVALCMSLVCNNTSKKQLAGIASFCRLNKIELIVCIILSGMYLYIGDRGFPIFVIIVFLFTYSYYYRKIRFSVLFSMFVAFAFLMFAIRETRTGDNSIKNAGLSTMFDTSKDALDNKPAILVFSDLLGANNELCTGLEYVDVYGLDRPEQVLLIPLTPFPLLPSLGSSLIYGTSNYTSLLASSVFNEFTLNNYGSKPHWGNHVTVDIYYRWGLIGIFIAFFLFGYVVSMIEKKQPYSLFYKTSYLLLIGLSIYLSRDSIISYIRPLTWTFIIIRFYELKLRKKL